MNKNIENDISVQSLCFLLPSPSTLLLFCIYLFILFHNCCSLGSLFTLPCALVMILFFFFCKTSPLPSGSHLLQRLRHVIRSNRLSPAGRQKNRDPCPDSQAWLSHTFTLTLNHNSGFVIQEQADEPR